MIEKSVRNILCYSHYAFDDIMKKNNWIKSPPSNVSCISICSPNEDDLSEHWFKNDCHSNISNVFNLDIDDINPFWFKNHENKCYDDALNLYIDGKIKQSNAYFNNIHISGQHQQWVDILHALDYEEAFDLVKWIDDRIKLDETIFVHCTVGASRSQGVVRYIIDTYRDEYDIRLNPDNPNDTYNPHVVMMLKRAYRHLYTNNINDSYFDTEEMTHNEQILLNLL